MWLDVFTLKRISHRGNLLKPSHSEDPPNGISTLVTSIVINSTINFRSNLKTFLFPLWYFPAIQSVGGKWTGMEKGRGGEGTGGERRGGEGRGSIECDCRYRYECAEMKDAVFLLVVWKPICLIAFLPPSPCLSLALHCLIWTGISAVQASLLLCVQTGSQPPVWMPRIFEDRRRANRTGANRMQINLGYQGQLSKITRTKNWAVFMRQY